MSNYYFKFKQFTVFQDKTAMKVGVDSVVLGAWTDLYNVQSILDIGTGTGILSLMLAQKCDASVTAIEMDKDAYIQATENIKASKWFKRIEVIHTTFQEYLVEKNKNFDLIICNPPYFSNSLHSPNNKRSIARHSLHLEMEEILSDSKNILNERGSLCVIYPYQQKNELLKKAKHFGYYPYRILDMFPIETKQANRVMVQFMIQKTKTINERLSVKNCDTNQYTKEFKKLTMDYYLAF